jgi:hypothetical protein
MSITRSALFACVVVCSALGCGGKANTPAAGAPGGAAGTSTDTTGAVGDDSTGGAGGPAGTNEGGDAGVDAPLGTMPH